MHSFKQALHVSRPCCCHVSCTKDWRKGLIISRTVSHGVQIDEGIGCVNSKGHVCVNVCVQEREREREIKWWRARENPVVCVYCVCVCMCKGLMVTVSTSYGPSHWHVNPNPGDYARTLFSPPPRMTVHVKCTWEIHYRIPTLVKSYRTIRYLSVWMNQRQIEILTISALISP